MGVITYEFEVISSLSPAKLFKAFVLDIDTLILKVLPQAIKNIESLEGDGGVGTIKLITFGEGSQVSSVKRHVEELDKDKLTCKYSVVDGDDALMESISYVNKIEAYGDGCSICKHISTYITKDDANINQDHFKATKEKANGMFEVVEAYVVANPNY